MQIDEALKIIRTAGYRVSKPKPAKNKSGTVNPFNHPYPHAKLHNVTLTSITRLAKGGDGFPNCSYRNYLIGNNDPRNYTITGRVP